LFFVIKTAPHFLHCRHFIFNTYLAGIISYPDALKKDPPDFAYKAQSDEQKLGLLDLVFNLETGAYVPGMAELILAAGKNFITLQKPAWKKGQLETAVRCIKEQSAGILAGELSLFHETMTRRFKRDAANLEEYLPGP